MPDDFTFYTDTVSWGIETKSNGERVPYVQGYVSTPEMDIYNDIVTQECLDDMLLQIKSGNIKLDVEHEAWRKSPKILPAGKIVEAKRDSKGIWIKAMINRYSPNFKSIWGSIKDGFLDAFSIAYKAVKAEEEIVNGVKARILKKIELLNVALTGNPVNPECRMQAVFMKSVQAMGEGDTMVEKKDEPSSSDSSAPEMKAEGEYPKEKKAEEAKKEEPAKEAKEEAKKEPEKEEDEEEKKSLDELKAKLETKSKEVETKDKEIEEKDKEIAELKAKLKEPVLKAQVEQKSKEDQPELKASGRSPLELIR